MTEWRGHCVEMFFDEYGSGRGLGMRGVREVLDLAMIRGQEIAG